MKPFYLEILGYAIALLIGLITFWLGKKNTPDRKVNLLIGLLTTVIGFFIVSQWFIRFVHLDKIVENQEYIENLKADDESVNIALDLSKSKGKYADENNGFFERILRERRTNFREFLNELSDEQIVYNQKDFPVFEKDVIKVFEELESNQVVLATSRVNVADWWKKENFGKAYFSANQECVKNKQVLIKRIWIFDDETEFKNNEGEMKRQKEIGIETLYVFNSQIRDIVEKKRDLIVIGSKYAGELILNDRDMSKVIFHSNRDIVRDLKENWDELRKKAKVY